MSKVVEYSHEEEGGLEESPLSDGSCESQRDYGCYPGAPGADTLIIFDWDDTLLCSSAIGSARWDWAQLQQLERVAEDVLSAAMGLGETMIVTNGNATWVQDSTRRYLPGLESTLEGLRVVSARAAQEGLYPGNPFAWKRETFREILQRRLLEDPDAGPLNLVVVGDSGAEMEAAHYAAKAGDLVKTVKFREGPSVNQLLGQLRRTYKELPSLVAGGQSSSVRLQSHRLPAHLGHMAAWQTGWRFATGRDWSSPQKLSTALFTGESDDDEVVLELPQWVLELTDKLNHWTKTFAALKY